jgi:cation transport protein ChaC
VLTTAPEAKRLGLLHGLVPGAKVVGVLIDPNYQQAEAQARGFADRDYVLSTVRSIEAQGFRDEQLHRLASMLHGDAHPLHPAQAAEK